jgi:CRP/FNR family transcriptional regulator, anaerobic regulatory protein
MARWQRALSEADAWLTELSTGSARQRVARLLLRLVRDRESSECELFSREDMGAMLGVTTETTSRTIAEFKRQSLLVETSGQPLPARHPQPEAHRRGRPRHRLAAG